MYTGILEHKIPRSKGHTDARSSIKSSDIPWIDAPQKDHRAQRDILGQLSTEIADADSVSAHTPSKSIPKRVPLTDDTSVQ